MRNVILCGDVREQLRTLEPESVHCVVTSPPYWGLRSYGVEGQLGLEATPDEFVCNLVDVFREVRRVLRSDGTVWLNLGDSYAGSWGAYSYGRDSTEYGRYGATGAKVERPVTSKLGGVLKPKDLVGIPWRVAFALQADGWWLRSDIIWAKPNPMPESVTDRPTKAHEYLFLLSKSERYYYDAEAIREPASYPEGAGNKHPYDVEGQRDGENANLGGALHMIGPRSQRNKRTVWTVPTEPFSEAHFATFPQALVMPCVLAGTSERGCCPECGAPWERVVERTESAGFEAEKGKWAAADQGMAAARLNGHKRAARLAIGDLSADNPFPAQRTVGWRPTCCHEAEPVRSIILDPFMGAGTTALVALRTGRDFIGIDISEAYVTMAEERIAPVRERLL